MSSSYGAGATSALVKEFHLTKPDIVITGSGGAGTMAYFVAGQYDLITKIWTNLLSTRKFINPIRFWRVMDVDYLIDNVFKKQASLDVGKVSSSNIKYLISATNLRTGKIEYFSNNNHDDIFEALRATKAVPIIFNKKIMIQGEKYCDTSLSAEVGSHVMKAVEMGATDILVIDTINDNHLAGSIFHVWFFFRNKLFRKNYVEQKRKVKVFTVPRGINIITLSPSRRLQARNLNNNKKALIDNMKLGYRDCKNSIDVKEPLSNPK